LEKTEIEKVIDENETPKSEGPIQSPIADTVPQQDEKEATTQEDESEQENSATELEKVSLSSDPAKPSETNGSKLSAAAKPFSPGTLSASRHINPVPLASIYDVNGSQGILVEPILPPPAAARVPCGPRSPLYYRTNYTFRMKHGSTKIREISGSGGPRIMNPHAPEFVPRSASQTEIGEVKNSTSKNSLSESEKSEIARQILLSFLVKSVHQNADAADEPTVSERKVENFENSTDEVAKDSAVIKIMYGTEENNKTVVNSSDDIEEQENSEGFVVVTNRRKNRQKITNGVPELYNQPSICASVR
jgi:protein TIF31